MVGPTTRQRGPTPTRSDPTPSTGVDGQSSCERGPAGPRSVLGLKGRILHGKCFVAIGLRKVKDKRHRLKKV